VVEEWPVVIARRCEAEAEATAGQVFSVPVVRVAKRHPDPADWLALPLTLVPMAPAEGARAAVETAHLASAAQRVAVASSSLNIEGSHAFTCRRRRNGRERHFGGRFIRPGARVQSGAAEPC
ncbi:hypothetical protein L7Q78_17795, partial [Achromobacter xylosoxidans]|nr:hypothetical protein [Achromobacter xylosoxidans]